MSDDTSELFGLGFRVALIWSLLRTLRVTLESPSAELLSDARERKWIDQQGNWVYLRWNRSTRTLEPDEHRQPMNQTDLVSLLKTTGSLADGETVSRFAATRQLTASMEGVVTFKVDIQFRSPRAHQLYVMPLGHLSPKGELPATEWNPEACGMVRLRQAVWTNPSNLCYLNALVRCLCWALLGFPDWDQAISRLGMAAIRSLSLRIAPVCPFDLRGWRSLLSRWARPTAQQDCAELLAHLAECINSNLLAGRWEARVLDAGSVRVVDSGHCYCTLGLDPPSAARADVQALVGYWHGQHTLHALRYPPQVLILRIARYNQAASGAVVKNHCVITWSRFLSVPAFSDDALSTTLLRYRICAATYHVGPLLTSGHYTCSLIAADQAWYCDDGVQPTPRNCSGLGFEFASDQVYLLWATLEPAHVNAVVRMAATQSSSAPAHV